MGSRSRRKGIRFEQEIEDAIARRKCVTRAAITTASTETRGSDGA